MKTRKHRKTCQVQVHDDNDHKNIWQRAKLIILILNYTKFEKMTLLLFKLAETVDL